MSKNTRVIVIVLVLVVAVGALVAFIRGYAGSMSRPATVADAEQGIMSDPEGAKVGAALKRNFPDQYQALLTSTTAVANTGGTREERRARVAQITVAQLTGILSGVTPSVARAPDAPLVAHARAYHVLVEGLAAHDVKQCARFFAQGSLREQAPPQLRGAASDLTVATLDAAKAGMDAPVSRPMPPSEADSGAFTGALRARGVDPRLVDMLVNGTAASADPTGQCTLAREASRAAAITLPPAQGARIWSALMTG